MGKELTVADRAKDILASTKTEQDLARLATKYADIKDCRSTTDYSMIKRGHLDLVKARTTIQKTGKAARDDANKLAKAIIAEENRLLSITAPEESRLKTMRDDWEAAEKRRQEESERKERERVAGIRARIEEIRAHERAPMNETAAHLEQRVATIEGIQIDAEGFGESTDEALHIRSEVLEAVKERLFDRQIYEEEQVELARQAEEQAKERARLEEERKALEEKQRAIEESERKRREEEEAKKGKPDPEPPAPEPEPEQTASEGAEAAQPAQPSEGMAEEPSEQPVAQGSGSMSLSEEPEPFPQDALGMARGMEVTPDHVPRVIKGSKETVVAFHTHCPKCGTRLAVEAKF